MTNFLKNMNKLSWHKTGTAFTMEIKFYYFPLLRTVSEIICSPSRSKGVASSIPCRISWVEIILAGTKVCFHYFSTIDRKRITRYTMRHIARWWMNIIIQNGLTGTRARSFTLFFECPRRRIVTRQGQFRIFTGSGTIRRLWPVRA